MKIVHFDGVGGASGDMVLGALVDLGAPLDDLRRALKALPIGDFEIVTEHVKDEDISGTRLTVRVPESHGHRHLHELTALIESSSLPDEVRAQSVAVFQRLAEAEARVHGITPDQVHFHEVGAVDAVVDIVGNCLALHWLGATAVSVAPLPLGHGEIRCAHGTLPSPAPATLELLRGTPVTYVDEPYELVTPTGAALLTTWRSMTWPPPASRILRIGYGYGHRRLAGRPNVLRATLLEPPASDAATGTCWVIECNVDDTTPELLGAVAVKLLEAGALDVFLTPVQMKKERPGVLITVLAPLELRERMHDLLFRETTTFGLREHAVSRIMLQRRFEEIETPYGRVRIKIGRWRGEDVTAAPEFEDCRRLAQEKGVAVRAVYEAALRGWTRAS